MSPDLKEVPMWKNTLLKAYVKAQVWGHSVLEQAREDLKDPRKRVATTLALAAGALAGSALAINVGNELTQTASAVICPIARFLVGPLAWAGIAAGFAVGVLAMAFGGRGAIRWMIASFAAAVLLVIGKTYFTRQAGTTYAACFQ
jgi:LytS/YehU family sensor histidine kinase